MSKSIVFFFVGFLICLYSIAQPNPKWDDTAAKHWDDNFKEVGILSSKDNKIQKAYLYSSNSKTPKPLVVSLHTWSGDYAQEDPLTKEILARDWNYIHPDFRGPNNNPEAGGSALVISDIEDAILYAIAHTNTDPDEVHIIGVSGGGYATLLAYMNIRYPVKSFSAWVPISDLESWYYESIGRNQKYANDIMNIVSDNNSFEPSEARHRSPIYQIFPKELRKEAKLYLYEGIHDGYRGSVPITHSINMYNRLVGDLKYNESNLEKIMKANPTDPDLVSEKTTIDLLSRRFDPNFNENEKLFDRNVYLSKSYDNVSLLIFEGGHEQMPQALSLIPYNHESTRANNFVILGDSNAKNTGGWVDQMQKLNPGSKFINISESGRTIGFDNLGIRALNALANIDSFLDKAAKVNEKQSFDYIIICLGTNDAKNEFSDRQNEVLDNFNKLLEKVKLHDVSKNSNTEFIYVTPPPIGANARGEKYKGANERISILVPDLSKIALQHGFKVIDIYNPLLGILDFYAQDGVHMNAEGQEIIAQMIINEIFD